MGLHAEYWLTCDICEEDTTSSRPTIEEAIEYAERGGWSIYDDITHSDKVFCENCLAVLESSRES